MTISNDRGRAAPVFLIVLAGIAAGAAELLLYVDTASKRIPGPLPDSLLETVLRVYETDPLRTIYMAGIPIVVGLLAALLLSALTGKKETAPAPAPEAEPAPPDEALLRKAFERGALHFLSILQNEGRLIDFLEEDLTPYDDAQVGAAVRPIQEGCRKAIAERITIERIYDLDEGSTVEIPPDFDPAAVRLTGNVQGSPPFRGVLQHTGWKTAKLDMPVTTADVDPTILAPAEVEIE